MTKALVSARALASKAVIPISKNSKPEEIAQYRKQLQIPEAPEGYADAAKVEPPKLFKYEGDDAKKTIDGFYAIAHEQHMTPGQVKAVMTWFNNHMDGFLEGQGKQYEAASNNAQASLKKLWGNDYQKNFDAGKRFVQQGEDQAFAKWLDETVVGGMPLSEHPQMIQWAAQRGLLMGEQNLVLLTSEERKTGDDDHARLTKEAWDARGKGDMDTYRSKMDERARLSEKRFGTRPV